MTERLSGNLNDIEQKRKDWQRLYEERRALITIPESEVT